MKFAYPVSLALLIGAGMLSAQQSNTEQTRAHCPIAMRAQHMADGEMVRTGNPHPHRIGQWLRLELTSPDSRRIVTATLTIRGLAPKGRAMDTLKNEDDSYDTVTQQSVHFTAGSDSNYIADLWVPEMTAVQTIEISSVNYGDGSTWKHAGDMTCRVTPDGLMPIDGR